ncbi:MAG: Stp1/IreP family PP2C-type Ser/Thr phosphatase [Clostridiales bacterium]|nr:Stp1/IreP family PP2C-type Ser/Thr phosphatase [Clostridiales bacterium]MDY3745266.1 Stp1/IreP family PP2C-type Ser/Thr phosphatase [Lachnospiraceae bacterium]
MKVFGKTDIGVVRTMNQDYLFYSTEPVGVLPNLFIVADGMGGHKAGDYASRLAVENFVKYVREAKTDVPIRIVDDAVRYVNRLVLKEASENEDYAGMGTTFVAAFIKDDILFVANIGDSRLYLIDDELTQVTEDHSFVGAMLRAGEITKEEAARHPDKNIITRAIGAAKEPKVDFFEVDLEKGDRILLCSDGLTNMVSDEVIQDIFASCYIGDIADELIEEAKKNGGTDNISVIVIDPFDEEVAGC